MNSNREHRAVKPVFADQVAGFVIHELANIIGQVNHLSNWFAISKLLVARALGLKSTLSF